MIKPISAAVLVLSLLVIAGCDQVENTSRQVLNSAADSAKKALDDTHKAATSALDDARKELSLAKPEAKEKSDSAAQDI